MKNWETMVDMIASAYISTMGIDKWNSLTDEQKHDAVMILARDLDKAIR